MELFLHLHVCFRGAVINQTQGITLCAYFYTTVRKLSSYDKNLTYMKEDTLTLSSVTYVWSVNRSQQWKFF